jgi:hypothetical protein
MEIFPEFIEAQGIGQSTIRFMSGIICGDMTRSFHHRGLAERKVRKMNKGRELTSLSAEVVPLVCFNNNKSDDNASSSLAPLCEEKKKEVSWGKEEKQKAVGNKKLERERLV